MWRHAMVVSGGSGCTLYQNRWFGSLQQRNP
jgi:hypothetical protein